MAFAAPAIEPAAAICAIERSGKGEMIRLERENAPKRREFTPAIPRRGEAIPVSSKVGGVRSWVVRRRSK